VAATTQELVDKLVLEGGEDAMTYFLKAYAEANECPRVRSMLRWQEQVIDDSRPLARIRMLEAGGMKHRAAVGQVRREENANDTTVHRWNDKLRRGLAS
jgi:hypothetical protein